MKRLSIFFIILFFPLLVFSQENFKAFYYFPEDKILEPELYNFLIYYYSENIDDYESVNGETVIEIPKNIKVKANRRTTVIEGFIVQYEWTIFASGKDVTIHPMDCDLVEIDFINKKIKQKTGKDDKCILKPKNLKEKIKEKDKKKALGTSEKKVIR